MNRLLKFALGLLILIQFAACVSQHQQLVHFPDQHKPIENEKKGRIYVIRHPWLWNIASHMALVSVYDGNLEIGSIAGHRGFLSWERDPGQASIICVPGPGQVILTIENGKVYYILQHLEPDWGANFPTGLGGEGLSSRLELVDEETGRKELSKAKPPNYIK
jgi:hypothetical protein